MKKSQTKALRDTPFRNQRLEPVGIDIIPLRALRERVPRAAERVEFLMLMIVRDGVGTHVVDFERIDLCPGRVVVVRPGQVQQWQLSRGLDADILLVEPSALASSVGTRVRAPTMALLRLDDWSSSFDLNGQEQQSVESLTRMLERELASTPITELSATLARELLLCLLLGMSRSASRQTGSESPRTAFVRQFQRALDEAVYRRPTVEALARRLGVSTSALTRNCRSELGRSTKDLIDRRLALEVQRLLVHTPETSVSIGERLGFSEPTNFVKFFRRVVGMTPEAFRKAHRLH